MKLAVRQDLRQHQGMRAREIFRRTVKSARRRGAYWVRILDGARLLASREGRSRLWTQNLFRDQIHQGSQYTELNRYPALFRKAHQLAPGAQRLLSFGCSSGEELISLRAWFPEAVIVGVEINHRSRKIAASRVETDARTHVIEPAKIEGTFDVIFALSVLQRDPHKISESGLTDISSIYPFDRFDAEISRLADRLESGGLFCVINAQYRLEDTTAASIFTPVDGAPQMTPPIFDRHGRLLMNATAYTIFRKA